MKKHSRREFIRETSQAALMLSAWSALGGANVSGAERPRKLRLGIIGCGFIMSTHIKRVVGLDREAAIAWLCDVDPRQLEKSQRLVPPSARPKTTSRFEDVLDDADVDACIIATPNHWHAPIALAAIAAGKDVYIEKPFSHVYAEGPLIIAAAKKHGRVVQHGIQMRSSPVTDQAQKLLQDGIIGEIKIARAWTAEQRPTLSAVADSSPPAGVDYDRWLGPAPVHAFNERRFHKTWRMFRDYSNGDIGDDGVHELDLATWGLGVQSLPSRITAHGSRMLAGHASEFPDTMNVTYEFPDGKRLVYEQLSTTPYGIQNVDNGNIFYGTEGYMVFSRRGFFSVFLGPKSTPGPTEDKQLRGQRGYNEHLADFLQAIRNRAATRASAETAHRCCALAHLGGIASQVRGQLSFDPQTEKFRDCDEANALLTKSYRAGYGLPEKSTSS
jgi:predicted dehydrogenase